ncbi:replication protein A 32 kDa subunit-B [Scaptodrosophila lebanonensis]|uniref:Replication protein A 32 kDa subunit-B n=1 Tax=Drosophila lebanonensis TaxID=7225 RepID=A0A6J2TP45_DROLE|nr:replication protein A 32 kDa subunit-B [Scaptodrosophila lebanonensis]XP_030376742.1 replication protein A 32 kDa subunit-B [Scaptodrosophila lebanonensis]
MNDSFGDFNATQTATGGAASEPKSEGVASVLIRQVNESPDSNFSMFGQTFGMVCIVGILRDIETSSTKITYLVEDHTGRINVHLWLEEGDALKAPDLMVNNYMKIFGTVRGQGGQKTIMAFSLTPVTDANELSTHLLEALLMRYKIEEFKAKDDGGMGMSSGVGGMGMGVSRMETDGDAAVSGLDDKQQAVYQAIKKNVSNEGISRRELKSKFSHISDTQLNEILEFMISEGHIYSSIDPDHFISTM